jgi:hypothetical protein
MNKWEAVRSKNNGYVDIVERHGDNFDSDVCTCFSEYGINNADKIAALPEMFNFIRRLAEEGNEEAQKIIDKLKYRK